MEKFFMSQLHLFQFLSDSTVNATVYMLIGMPLLEAQLLHEHCMQRRLPGKKQLAVKKLKSHRWTVAGNSCPSTTYLLFITAITICQPK